MHFLSVLVDETTDVSNMEQLSVIARLDKRDDVVERLLNFYNVSSGRTAPAISSIVKDVFTHYGDSILNKLIMQTYDRASVISGHMPVMSMFLIKFWNSHL